MGGGGKTSTGNEFLMQFHYANFINIVGFSASIAETNKKGWLIYEISLDSDKKTEKNRE